MPDTAQTTYTTWICEVCGFVYDEAAGLPEEGIPAGTRWEDVAENWACPDWDMGKEEFRMVAVGSRG